MTGVPYASFTTYGKNWLTERVPAAGPDGPTDGLADGPTDGLAGGPTAAGAPRMPEKYSTCSYRARIPGAEAIAR